MRHLLAALLLATPIGAAAQQATITVDHAWCRPAIAGHQGAVYMTITDAGASDSLTGASTPVATTAELHRTTNDNGVMKMRAVPSLPVDQGASVTLTPGGYHLMLMNLKQDLNQGQSFPVTLTFAKAGQVTATVTVAKSGAGGMSQRMDMPGSGKQP
jgi:periplasmic copper chaperone A